MNRKARRAALLKAAQSIVDQAKAEDRDLTRAEVADIEAKTAEIKQLDIEIANSAKSEALEAAVLGMATQDQMPDTPGFGGAVKGARFDLRGVKGALVEGMAHASGSSRYFSGFDYKGIAPAGEAIVTIPIVNPGDPVATVAGLEAAPRLVELLPTVQRQAVYKILRETLPTDPGGASVVAPGAVKPTKRLGLDTVEDRLRVVAVVSEAIDKYMLADVNNLSSWVGSSLVEAIMDALEDEILTGDGTGEHFTGLANVSGAQVQTFVGDPLVTLRHALSKLQVRSMTPNVIALAPADWLTIVSTRNASGNFDLNGPINAETSTAWGCRVAVVPGLEAGTGWVIASDALTLAHDNAGIRVEWGTPGDAFVRNQLVARVEGRFNLDILRPHGLVKIDLSE